MQIFNERTKRLSFILGILSASFFLWLALRHADFGSVKDSFAKANYLWALPAIASLFLFYLLKAIRWAQIIDPDGKLPAPAVFPSMMIGFAGNNLLPLRLGELVRIYVGSRDVKKSMTMITATLIVERVLDVISVLALISLAIQYLQQDIPELVTARTFFFFTTFVAIAASWIVVAPPPRLKRILDAALLLLPVKLRSKSRRKLSQIRNGFSVFKSGAALLSTLLLNSLLQWTLLAACIYCSIIAFGLLVSPPAAFIVLGLIVAGISLPSTPGFLGVIEYCFVLGLGWFGISSADALSAAIFYHVLSFSFVTLVGMLCLKRRNFTLRSVAKAASAANTSTE